MQRLQRAELPIERAHFRVEVRLRRAIGGGEAIVDGRQLHDLDGADDFAVANVDNDGAMELIVNTGLVYDLNSGENQWYNGSGFGSEHVAAGDINGDGVAEIFGASRWGAVTVYDARDRSQLAAIDDLNICDLISYDIDQDNRDELLTADCQWGNISAYSLNGGSLVND